MSSSSAARSPDPGDRAGSATVWDEAVAPGARDPVQSRWGEVCTDLVKDCAHEGLRRWLSRVSGVSLADGVLQLWVRGASPTRWMEWKYRELIQEVARRRFGAGIRVRVSRDTSIGGALSSLGLRPNRPSSASPPPPFVVTEESRAVHLGLQQAAKATRPDFNPWTIVGTEGVGKTLLVRSFLAARQRRFPTESWCFQRGLEFFREFSAKARAGKWSEFRGRFLAHDGWILDDLHELSGKLRCQDQLAQLLEHHAGQGRWAVLTTRPLPRSSKEFSPHLRSLLQGGLSLPLPELCAESRAEVLRRRVPGPNLPEALIDQLAEGRRPLRECIDDCWKVQRYAKGLGREPSQKELRERFPELVQGDRRADPMDHLLDRCAEFVGVERAAIVAGSRSRGAALGRHLCVHLALDVCGISRATVKRWLGTLSPSVVPYARRKVEDLRTKDPRLDGFVREVSGEVMHGQQLLF